MWSTEVALVAVGGTVVTLALIGRVLSRYYELHKPLPELWHGETIIHSTPMAWRFEGDSRERTGWGYLTDLRLIWIPMLMTPLTRYVWAFQMHAHRSLPQEPIELRRTHLVKVQRLEDRRALSFESEGRPVVLFFFSDDGRNAREAWLEHLAATARRGVSYSTDS